MTDSTSPSTGTPTLSGPTIYSKPSFLARVFTFDKTWKVVLLLLMVFTFGSVVGGAIVARIVRNATVRAMNPGKQTEVILARLTSQLKLTDAQIETVRPIVQKAAAKLQTIVDETRERTRAELGASLIELNEKLTPEQQEVLKKNVATLHKRAETFRARTSERD